MQRLTIARTVIGFVAALAIVAPARALQQGRAWRPETGRTPAAASAASEG